MKALTEQNEKCVLNPENIDRISETVEKALTDIRLDRKDILRVRLMFEETLLLWSERFGAVNFGFGIHARFGGIRVEVSLPGERVDPNEDAPDGEESKYFFSGLSEGAGLFPVYSYDGGVNRLSLRAKKKRKLGTTSQTLLAVLAAVVLALAFGLLPHGAQDIVSQVSTAMFDTSFGVLRGISMPLIFLCICVGVCGLDSLSSFSKIGLAFTKNILLWMSLFGVATLLSVVWFFDVSGSGVGATGGFSKIFELLLDSVPSDIISPFLNGNAMQLTFMGICLGVALLVAGEKVSKVTGLVEQLYHLLACIMNAVGRLIPFFVFLSIFTAVISGTDLKLRGMVKCFVMVAVVGMAMFAVLLLFTALRLRVSLMTLVKKLFPIFIICLTTASSSAALSTSMEICGKKLGISSRAVNFGVPFGHVLFFPGAVVYYLCLSLCMAEQFSVEISLPWILMALVVSVVVSMAEPPMPGAALVCHSIIFSQLGIPDEALFVAIAVSIPCDFILTAIDVTSVPCALAISADKLGMLNHETLKK